MTIFSALTFLLFFSGILSAQTQPAPDIILPSIISDNMILQQKSKVTIWGKTKPNTKISVSGSWGKSTSTVSKTDSSFQVKILTPKAGGSYKLTISNDRNSIVIKNILIGEVWLASGQSNMEMPLSGWLPDAPVNDSEMEISQSKDENLRFFTVEKQLSLSPEFSCRGSWTSSSPNTSPAFSATAYFFAEKLRKELNVPIGIIHSSWGGSPIEGWISSDQLIKRPELREELLKLSAIEKNRAKLSDWFSQHKIIDMTKRDGADKWRGLSFDDSLFSLSDLDDSNWKSLTLPKGWESTSIGEFDGVIWFRKTVQIPDSWIGKDLILELGPIDDMDATFVNGTEVGNNESTGKWNVDRVYFIKSEFVKSGSLTIAVRVIDNYGGGGLYGDASKLKLRLVDKNEDLSLSGDWKYSAVAEYRDQKFIIFKSDKNDFENRPFSLTHFTPTALFNGMISPIMGYGIAGTIWYQGETNTVRPDSYQELLGLLISNWRSVMNSGDSPFYFAQIAPFEYGDATESQKLREAQMKSLSIKNTGMAVTLDLGDSTNIHPSNKKDVGERLALIATSKTYGKGNEYSGPTLRSVKSHKNSITLTFDHADGGLILKDNAADHFMIAGEDKLFIKPNIIVRSNQLILSHPAINNPIAVRYGWKNYLKGNLFNSKGLPASSFRTDHW